jgi:hypothetical protein
MLVENARVFQKSGYILRPFGQGLDVSAFGQGMDIEFNPHGLGLLIFSL